jgi:hypothetical protein
MQILDPANIGSRRRNVAITTWNNFWLHSDDVEKTRKKHFGVRGVGGGRLRQAGGCAGESPSARGARFAVRGWLLRLGAVSTVDRLCKDICKFLSSQHRSGRESGSNSTASGVRSVVSIQSEEERRRLQARQAKINRMNVSERQLEECR